MESKDLNEEIIIVETNTDNLIMTIEKQIMPMIIMMRRQITLDIKFWCQFLFLQLYFLVQFS